LKARQRLDRIERAQGKFYCFGDRGSQMVTIDRLQEPAGQTGRQLVDCKQLHTLRAGKRCLRPAMAPSVAVRDDNGAEQRRPAYRIRLPLLERDRNIDKPSSRPGQTQVAHQISSAMDTANRPRVCRDFNVALPITAYRQTYSTARSAIWTSKAARPFIGYQTIPFQRSLHAIDGDGVPHDREFLADGGDDPRRRFAETLIEAFAAFDAPILVYSAYGFRCKRQKDGILGVNTLLEGANPNAEH